MIAGAQAGEVLHLMGDRKQRMKEKRCQRRDNCENLPLLTFFLWLGLTFQSFQNFLN